MTTADVVERRILIRPSLADLMRVRIISGASWDHQQGAFCLDATAANATRVRHALPALTTTVAFSALDAPPAASAATPRPEAPQRPSVAPKALVERATSALLPPGLRVQAWTHQVEGYEFAMRAIREYHAVLLAGQMGVGKTCVAAMVSLGLDARAILVVCPLRVIGSWRDQLQQYIDGPFVAAPLLDDLGTVAKRVEFAKAKRALAAASGRRFFCIVNYDVIWREPLDAWLLSMSWDLIIYDECFPAGTGIDTPNGRVPIEEIESGDVVYGYDHDSDSVVETTVAATFARSTGERLLDLGFAQPTPSHPVWTKEDGYKPARVLDLDDQLLELNPNGEVDLRRVRSFFRAGEEATLLQQVLLGEVASAELPEAGLVSCCAGEDGRQDGGAAQRSSLHGEGRRLSGIRPESISQSGTSREGDRGVTEAGIQNAERREWDRGYTAAEAAGRGAGLASGARCSHGAPEPDALQAGRREPGDDDLRGGRWAFTSGQGSEDARRPEGRVPEVAGLDGAPVLEQARAGEPSGCDRGDSERTIVFNIETGTGNYFANGVLVHNCHKLKTPGGRASMFAKRLLPHAAARVLASGTPLAHSPLDVFAQFRAAAPAIFGPSYAAFKARYARLGGPDKKWIVGYQNTEDLERRMAPLTWRKTKAEALPYLPEQIDVEYTTELCPEAARIYREIERDMVAEFQGGKLTAANCLTKILRLQQLTGGAVPDDAGHHHQVDTGKRRLLQDTLEDLGDQPSVIFCRFRSDITAAHEACEAAGRKSLELSGTRNDLEAWQSGDLVHHVTDATGCSIPTVYSVLHGHSDDRPVRAAIDTYFRIRGIDPSGPMGIGDGHDLVVQVQSGSVGISLVRASVAIYYSLSSNLVEYDQSRSRIHRPGQKNACQYIYLTCQGTVDQKILKALRNRQDVIEEIMTLIAERARR